MAGEQSFQICIFQYLSFQINQSKNYSRMDRDHSTPAGQSLNLQFDDQFLTISEPAPGKITINFDELQRNLKHEIKEAVLIKINYKTVVAALKGNYPNIISAKLVSNESRIYTLIIKVSYQFLPQVKEQLVFQKRQIGAEQSELVAVRSMTNYLRNIRQQIATMTNIQTLCGEYQNKQQWETFVKLGHPKGIITWGINFIRPSGSTLKLQMFYYNSLTKQTKSSQSIPDEGVFFHHNGDSAYCQIKFLAQKEDFDMIKLRIEGNPAQTASYTIVIQKVEQFA